MDLRVRGRSVVCTSLGLWGITVLAACGDMGSRDLGIEVTDSAGIRVVVNPLPYAEREATWTIGPDPKVTIGSVEGRAEYQLFDVSGAVVLSDGVLVLANRGTHELRFYDERGEYQRSAGGEGDGPGEFRSLDFVDRFASDSLLAFDGRHMRASVFDREGRFARSFSIGRPTDSAFPNLVGVLPSGAVVIREDHPYVAGVAATGYDRSPALLLLRGADGETKDTVGSFSGPETFVMAVPAEMWMSVRPVRFGRRLVTAVGGSRIAVAETDTFEVRFFDSEGALHEIVRQRRIPVTIEAADVNRFNESQLAMVDDERSRQHYREMFDLMPAHETYPALASIRLDRKDNLWVEEYGRPGDSLSAWQVFDAQARFTARVTLPDGFEVLDIGADYIVGVEHDALGVELIRWYPLVKAAS